MSVAEYNIKLAKLQEHLEIAKQEKLAAQNAIKNARRIEDDAAGDAAIDAVAVADAEIAAIEAEIAAITAASASAKGGRRKRSHRSKRRILKKRHTRRKHRTHRKHRK